MAFTAWHSRAVIHPMAVQFLHTMHFDQGGQNIMVVFLHTRHPKPDRHTTTHVPQLRNTIFHYFDILPAATLSSRNTHTVRPWANACVEVSPALNCAGGIPRHHRHIGQEAWGEIRGGDILQEDDDRDTDHSFAAARQ
jgi:hypothetical protein